MPYKDRAVQNAYVLKVIRRRREEWLNVNGPCKLCGSWKDLEVDHVDPKIKVSHKVWTWSKERREAELAKCQALCHLCHADKTWKEGGSVGEKPHGTHFKYLLGCRCQLCRDAHAELMRNYRAKKRLDLVVDAEDIGRGPGFDTGTSTNLWG